MRSVPQMMTSYSLSSSGADEWLASFAVLGVSVIVVESTKKSVLIGSDADDNDMMCRCYDFSTDESEIFTPIA